MFISLPSFKKTKISSGYTLIELLMGIVIIGLVFSVGTASYRTYQRSQVVETKTRDILADIRLAQGFALSGRSENCTSSVFRGYEFAGTNAEDKYIISSVCADSDEDVVYKEVSAPEGFTIQIFGANSADREFIFEPLSNGTNKSFDMRIRLKRESDGVVAKCILVTRTGVVNVVNTCP